MKAWLIAIIAAAAGTAAGFGMAWTERVGTIAPFPADGRAPTDSVVPLTESGERPEVVVEGGVRQGSNYTYDFGVSEVGVVGKHVFVFKNVGTAPLTLRKGEFTCSCTVAELKGNAIPPGGSAEITVEWTPKEYTELFTHGGDIHTNDPAHPVIHLAVTGRVIQAVRAFPADLVFENISANESKTASLSVYDYLGGEFQVTEVKFENPETAEFFDVNITPLTQTEVQGEPDAQGGVRVAVTAKPGLPLGPINQKIRLKLNRPETSEIVAPIHGRVVGDFSFIGPKFDSTRVRLHVGSVKSGEGASRTIHMMIKGPHRRDVEVKVARVSPEGRLEARLGDAREINNGAVVMVPLHVTVPADAPPGDFLGVAESEPVGEIELATTHPDDKTITVTVSFIVEKSK